MKPVVYFTREITPEKVLELYKKAGKDLPGKVAVKLHSGEKGNQNFLGPEFWKPVVEYVGGTVVECNTAYDGERNETRKHKKLLEDHGWSRYFDVDLLDAEGPDLELEIPNGKVIKKNYIGKDLADHIFLNEFEIVAELGRVYGNLLVGLGIHKVIKSAILIEVFHFLALNISGGEFFGGIKGALNDRACNNISDLGSYECSALTGFYMLKLNNLVNITVHLECDAVSEISGSNHMVISSK